MPGSEGRGTGVSPGSLVIVSIGGNALIRRTGTGEIDEQLENARSAMAAVTAMLSAGRRVVITHGNGPVVGNIVIRNEAARDVIPPMPLYICDADSEGGVGFLIQHTLYNLLHVAGAASGAAREVAAIVTQVVVDPEDPAFAEPTKPIGPWYTAEEAEAVRAASGWTMREERGRGYRRVVPSPRPVRVVEAGVIERLADSGVVVIAAGGGGVPVVERADGTLYGVDAVIDKDHATTLLAVELGAELIINLTEVDMVYRGYGTAREEGIGVLTVEEAGRLLAAGEFPAGSMGPKVASAVEFLERGGREVIITSPARLEDALAGEAGTRVVP